MEKGGNWDKDIGHKNWKQSESFHDLLLHLYPIVLVPHSAIAVHHILGAFLAVALRSIVVLTRYKFDSRNQMIR